MSHNTRCTFRGEREAALVAHFYEDYDNIGAAERTAFEAHLAGCAVCRDELAELGAVREGLARWVPPEPAEGRAPVVTPFRPRRTKWASFGAIPAWARAAAAVLVLGASAGVANLDIRYDRDGLTIRTGWLARPSAGPQVSVADAAAEAPWRAELTAAEARMREEMRTAAAPTPVVERDDAAVLDRVRAMVAASEERQERELALRVAEIVRDVQGWRRADLERIERSLGVIQSNAGVEMMRNRQLLNDLAVRVSQRP
jgi:hypothetical protein